MSTQTTLRLAVVLQWVFAGTGMVLSYLLESHLPAPLREWRAADEMPVTGATFLFVAAGILAIVLDIAASIGLLFLKRWGAWLFLAANTLGWLLMPLAGPTVEHALADTFDELGIVCVGAVLAVSFFTDALKPRPPGQAAPAMPPSLPP